MTELAAQFMSSLLTKPYRRGAEMLVIPLGADVGGSTIVSPYDFTEYLRRYDADPPTPRYVVFPKRDLGADPIDLEFTFGADLIALKFAFGAARGEQVAPLLRIPARTPAQVSFAVPMPANADASLRLLRVRQIPAPGTGAGADNWGIVALLGNIAKLAWVVGREKDLIAQHLRDVGRQRASQFAHGASLDNLGRDLRVPRFPAREHSMDAGTLALYHLNENAPDGGLVRDESAQFGGPGHPGVNRQAQSGVIGKFERGFGFPGPAGNGFIEVADHADFALAANRGLTVEVFVKVDTVAAPTPQIIIIGRSQIAIPAPQVIIGKGQMTAPGALSGAGWTLSVTGGARGFNNNPRWSVSDGASSVEIFADLDLADGGFHHLAGVIDREQQRARLLVDGEERAAADISAFGALTNTQPILMGRSNLGHQFAGVLDEVRLSSVPRRDFHPVLGEGDTAYQQRLGIFERWLLPTPDALLREINSVAQINGDPASFVLEERDRPSAMASKLVRIFPAALADGQSIDRDGRTGSPESESSGAPDDGPAFQEFHLLRHDKANVVYGADENNRRMQLVTRQALDRLVERIAAANPPIAGNLIVDRSFDPGGDGLHGVGRALLLRHQTLSPGILAPLAHRAGFDFVRNQGSNVYASVEPGELIGIVLEPTAPAIDPATSTSEFDLLRGETVDLRLEQTLPAAGEIKWTIIHAGAGRAQLQQYEQTVLTGALSGAATTLNVKPTAAFPANPPFKIRIDNEVLNVTARAATAWTVTRGVDGSAAASHAFGAPVVLALRTPLSARARVRLAAERPGEVVLRVEYTLQRQTVTGTRSIRIGVASLANGESIAADGDQRAAEDAVSGAPGEAINPIYLITTEVNANFGADSINIRKMQLVLERPFNRLVELLGPTNTGSLQVVKSFDPADTGLHKAGRAIALRHPSLDIGVLGALAHRAGFDFVRRQGGGAEIYCSVAPGEKIEIARASDGKPLPDELVAGETVTVRARFFVLPNDKNFNWSSTPIGLGRGRFDLLLRPQVNFTPTTPGLLVLNVTYLESDPAKTAPYSFEIKLNPDLGLRGVKIPKHQYDLIMNILNYFHPIGVEALTGQIRNHVVEIDQDVSKAFPAYTYPDFRV
jgi:hypothetical protein